MKKILSVIICLLLCIGTIPYCAGTAALKASAVRLTPVEKYGQLQVIGSQLCDRNGNPVQLRGMSSHGLAWYGEYCNSDVIQWLRDDWNCDIYRASMYTKESGGYIDNPSIKSKVYEAVDACIEHGLYVIIDWHILEDGNPQTYKTQAKAFFDEMSERYGSYPNVLYEIMNEPNNESGGNVTWAGDCKPYAQEVIPIIRANDPDNIVIVGGPSWSSLQQEVINSPLTGFTNIVYTVHQYTNESQSYWPTSRMISAMNKGMCVFVSEWGPTDADGDGAVKADAADGELICLGYVADWMFNNQTQLGQKVDFTKYTHVNFIHLVRLLL